jgi:ubiquinone biosynthesis protein
VAIAGANASATLPGSHALRDGYFHADMHQGNLKVAANGDVIAYDFGIMGEIDEYTRRVYAEILMGFIRRDYVRVAEVHFEAGYVPRDRDMHEFARALRAVGEPIFGMPMPARFPWRVSCPICSR